MTETERVINIIEEGARNRISLSEFINIQIEEFEKSDVYKEMLIGDKYAQNKSDIEQKKRTYIDENGDECEAKHFNNSKVKYPVVVKLTNQKKGYLLKRKMTIGESVEDGQKVDKEYNKLLNNFFNNRKHKMLKNTLNKSVTNGIAWWYLFIDNTELKAKLRYGQEIIPLWADREHESLDAVIVRYYITNYTKLKGKELIEKVEYHDFDGVRFYIRQAGKLLQDSDKIQENMELFIKYDEENNPIFANFKVGEELKTWEKIPFIYFKYNSEEQPLIHFIKSLVDELEKLKSAVSDKLIDNVDGIHTVKGYTDEVEKFQKNLQTFKTIFLDDNGEYDYKQGSIDIEAFKSAIEQLRKDIFDIGAGVDTESDKYGNQQSGVALKQLFNDLDLDCSNIEAEYQSSLEYFMFFFNTWNSLIHSKDYSEKQVEFIFNKSMITDETAKISDCKNSEGVVSKRTILANHPYVKDVDKELQLLKQEEQQELEETMGDYNKLTHKKNENGDVDDDEE